MMATDLVAGFLTGAALIVAIGAQNAFVLRQGILGQHVLPLVLICAGADALLIATGIAGLGALIEAAPALMTAARYGGAAFLFVYGVIAVRRTAVAKRLTAAEEDAGALGSALGTCLAFTFLNPHVYLDTVILIGSLAGQRGAEGRWVFGVGAAGASIVWFFLLGFGARLLAPVFAKPAAWRVFDLLVAVTMFALGAGLLLG